MIKYAQEEKDGIESFIVVSLLHDNNLVVGMTELLCERIFEQ